MLLDFLHASSFNLFFWIVLHFCLIYVIAYAGVMMVSSDIVIILYSD
jgi:hypothetical protein